MQLQNNKFIGILFFLFTLHNVSFGGGSFNVANSSTLTIASTTVCQNTVAPLTSATFTTVNCGGGGSTATTVSVAWYYNTTGATGTLVGATQLGATASLSSGTGATVTYTTNNTASVTTAYNALTATPGTYYIFCVVSNTVGTICAGGVGNPGSRFSGTAGVAGVRSFTVVAPPTTSSNGGNQTLAACATSTVLTGNTPVNGTGTWTVASSGRYNL